MLSEGREREPYRRGRQHRAVAPRGQTEMKYRGKYNIHQLFCGTLWLSCVTLSRLSSLLSFDGHNQSHIACLHFTFNKIATPNDHYQRTLSGPNWTDICDMKLDTKDPVLHKVAMMGTMSPLLLSTNGKMK